jgi:IS5 family transposase
LLKAVLIQKWFGLKSDPDLEYQINDRFPFRLPFSESSPDHSILCRFRERTGKDTLEKVHHELLNQFDSLGFSITGRADFMP